MMPAAFESVQSYDSDPDRDELTLAHVITSASNIRLKDLNLDKPLMGDNGVDDSNNFLKRDKKPNRKLIETDPRIEQTNGSKYSIFYAIKWSDSRFNELVLEGQSVLKDKEEDDLHTI